MGKYIHDSKLINENFDCHYINLTTAKGLQDIGKGGVKKMWRFVKLLRTISKEVSGLKPQLVYVTPNAKGGAFYKDFVVVQMLKRMGCKIVVHYHNKGVSTRQDCWLDDKLYRRFFNGLKVVLLAEPLYQDVKKYVRRENVYICPNGIPESLKNEPLAERHNKVPHLLFLSNLLISKGVLVLLDACKILKDRGYSFVCEFVGGETAEIDTARFDKEVRSRGLNTIAVYQGRKYGEEKHEAFEHADMFVFPTYYSNECFPLVLLEAMEQGLPCISTNEGGISDIIEDGKNGFIVEKQHAECLANAMEIFLNDKDMRLRMGNEGRKIFKTHFTLSVFEKRIKEILEQTLPK